jgi:hypothetical protein
MAATLAAVPAYAQEAVRPASGPRLVVTGRGTIEAAPDHATVSIGVTARAATAAAAIDETSNAAAKVAEAARAFGIEGRDIRTGHVSLQPIYRNIRDASGNPQQQIERFQASNSVQVRLRDLARVGEFLRRGVGEGANQIGSLSFGLAERDRAARQAEAAAFADAKAQAASLASAAGIKLGRIEEIRTGQHGGGPVRPLRMEMRAAAAPDVPVEPGSVELSAEVEVTWALEP